jgi:polyisoprenoid-binding protein YceI
MSTNNWTIDPTHSEIGFKVRHLMISNVKGHFGAFTSTVATEGDDLQTAAISFEADVHSINTSNEQRDAHLKGADFFDADNHPKITFTSTQVTKTGDHTYQVEGHLSVRGKTNPVTLEAIASDWAKDPWGQTKIAFELRGKINRTAFDLVWNAPLETGGVLVSEDVQLHADVQYVKGA